MLRIRIRCFFHFLLLYRVTIKINRKEKIMPMHGYDMGIMVIGVKITSKSVLYLQIQNTLCKIGKEPVLLACRLSC